MGKLNFEQVKQQALMQIDQVLNHWLAGGKRQGPEYVVENPTRQDSKPGSFSINTSNGCWSDFATDDRGGDLIDLVAYIDRVKPLDACKALAVFLGIDADASTSVPAAKPTVTAKPKQPDWVPVLPVPKSALGSKPDRHYKHGTPSMVWPYLDQQGRSLFWILRFDRGVDDNGKLQKDFYPLSYCKSPDGRYQWRWKGVAENRPLYRLAALRAHQGPVLLCEGEKAADAAAELLPEALCMAWPNGAKSIGRVDFSLLKGREVWLWPDNDDQGQECMTAVAEKLHQLGAQSVSRLRLSCFELQPGMAPDQSPSLSEGGFWGKGDDAADAVAKGWRVDHLKLLLDEGRLLEEMQMPSTAHKAATNRQPSRKKTAQDGGDARHSSYFVNDEGLYRQEDPEAPPMKICNRLDVLAKTRDIEGMNWGTLVRFKDDDNNLKQWNIPAELLASEAGAEIMKTLLSMGLQIQPGSAPKRSLLAYLQTNKSVDRARLVNRLGWHGDAYLLPEDQLIGDSKEALYYLSRGGLLPPMTQKGTHQGWIDQIGRYCIGNHRLTFAASVAFAGPLLWPIGGQSGGFHFYGESSKGKSTVLKVVASVYGGKEFLKTWRSTDNALEGIAAAHSDGLLLLDEMKQCNGRVLGEAIYMLGNGTGKSRANDRGQNKSKPAEWRLLFLSSGEKTLATYLTEAGMPCDAGMEIRLPGIPEDAGQGHGMFDTVHEFDGGAEFAQYLEGATQRQHGTAIIAFLERLVGGGDMSKSIAWINRAIPKFMAENVPKGASGQVQRAAHRFALVAAAGEMASSGGVTGWPAGAAWQGAKVCFEDWLKDRGGVTSSEDMVAISQVRHFFEQYGESRFTRWIGTDLKVDEHAPRTDRKCGYRQTIEHGGAYEGKYTETTYYVTPASWSKEVCKGLDKRRVNRILLDMGVLSPDDKGKSSKTAYLPGHKGKPRVYIVNASALAESGDAEGGSEAA